MNWERRGERYYGSDGSWEYMVGWQPHCGYGAWERRKGDIAWELICYTPTVEEALEVT